MTKAQLKLYQFPTRWGIPNESPFCMKLETFLRMTGLDFETVTCRTMWGAPKGKMPFIEIDGQKIGDTNFIIQYLKEKHGVDLDKHLNEAEKSIAHTVGRMLDENFYWCLIYFRWKKDSGFKVVGPVFFDFLPPGLSHAAGAYTRRQLISQLQGHGMGRHREEEILKIAKRDIKAVATLLGKKKFLMGDQPSTVDATLHGFLGNTLLVPLADPIQNEIKKHPNLVAHCKRMQESFFNQSDNS